MERETKDEREAKRRLIESPGFLSRILQVDEERGVLLYRESGMDVPTFLNTKGYRVFMIEDFYLFVHRAVCVLHGMEPIPEGLTVDHINRDQTDNRPKNLRICTMSQNIANQGLRKDNKSGCKGVSFDAKKGKWVVHTKVAGKRTTLGRFDDLNEAVEVYRSAAIAEWGEYAYLSPRATPVASCVKKEEASGELKLTYGNEISAEERGSLWEDLLGGF